MDRREAKVPIRLIARSVDAQSPESACTVDAAFLATAPKPKEGSMSQPAAVSQSALLRLARYHCLLEELLQEDHAQSIRSRDIATQLGVTEESVRGDLSHVAIKGRPGSGYDVAALHTALAQFLGLSDVSPFIVVGSLPMLEALPRVFPAEQFGMRPIAYFSEREQDVGSVIGEIEVQPLAGIAALADHSENVVALLACDPGHVDESLQALSSAGVHGVLVLTPLIRPRHPEGMQVTYFRIPCALKSLAASSRSTDLPTEEPDACCGCTPPTTA
jgi:redox-sensing transcriptional repressor